MLWLIVNLTTLTFWCNIYRSLEKFDIKNFHVWWNTMKIKLTKYFNNELKSKGNILI